LLKLIRQEYFFIKFCCFHRWTWKYKYVIE